MRNQKGQAVLIILLGMVVALTVVLSIISSTTSDIKLGSTSTSSLRAFSAAESGVEKALVALSNQPSTTLSNGATYTADVSGLAQGKTFFNYPSTLASGDTGVLWFVAHDNTGKLTCSDASNTCFAGDKIKVCWGKAGTGPSTATTPAIESSVYYLSTAGDYSTAKVAKAIIDPNVTRRGLNSYQTDDTLGSCTIDSVQYAFHQTINVPLLAQNGLQFMTVRMLYDTDPANPQPLGFDSSSAVSLNNKPLPSQGNIVSSTGSLNEATRRIEVSRAYSPVPPVFDAAIFSPGGLGDATP